MRSGQFGMNYDEPITSIERKAQGRRKLAMRIFDRELAIARPSQQRLNRKLIAQGMIPSSNADMIIHFDQPVYSGQFSQDGNFFFTANKDFKVSMYDTSNPYDWKHYKTVSYPFGRWTLTDASLSPDNQFLAYTSIQSNVCLASTSPNDLDNPHILDFSGQQNGSPDRSRHNFGIWSIRFSGNGRQLVAGATSGLMVVYDIESRTPLHSIHGHTEDVNAVSFADNSSNIIYTGSDDWALKIWDVRSLGDSRAAGVLIGHLEGLTYVESKGDGRYILSNAKDQSAKLWDVRNATSPQAFDRIRNLRPPSQFDYRFDLGYDYSKHLSNIPNHSLVTFRGHRVFKTLIRCHFSPPASTNSRYIYTGSADGKVYIWNLDASLVRVLDIYKSTYNTRPPGQNSDAGRMYGPWRTCVRDVSWHPTAPVIVASAWNGHGYSNGTCTMHCWNEDAETDIIEPRAEPSVQQVLNGRA